MVIRGIAWVILTLAPLSRSFPVDENLGFTHWPLSKRGEISASEFSNPQGPQFGVTDDTCRGHLPDGDCWGMREVTVDVSDRGGRLWHVLIRTETDQESSAKDERMHSTVPFLHIASLWCSGENR